MIVSADSRIFFRRLEYVSPPQNLKISKNLGKTKISGLNLFTILQNAD